MVAGPTNLAAFLNSLQMGFRTLAIQKRSSEVWEILGKVKKEFMTYGAVIQKVKEKLDSASKTLDEDVARRTKMVNRALKTVEDMPALGSAALIPVLADGEDEEDAAENN